MRSPVNLRDYIDVERDVLHARLADIGNELIGLVQEIGMIEGQRHQAKMDAFRESVIPTVAGREREADMNALTFTTTLYELKAEVEALQEEQRFIILLVDAR